MSRFLGRDVDIHLKKAKDSAIDAVDGYNRVNTRFRSGSYIVLMCISWTSLMHAVFFKKKVKPFYKNTKNNRVYVRVDGDYKAWELTTCLSVYYKGKTSPVADNLRFLIGLRNKIEHRSMPELDSRIFGECQACLFNFEDVLFTEFGAKHSMSECMSLAIQFSRSRDAEQDKAVARLQKPLQSNVSKYIEQFRSSLSSRTVSDLRYSYKVFLVPRVVGNGHGDTPAVEFIKYDSANPEDMEKFEKINAIIKPVVTEAVNAGKLKAGSVCKRLDGIMELIVGPKAEFLPSYHHVRAWQFYKVRPKKGDPNPEKTDKKYCFYDCANEDYVYTEEWVTFLCEELRKPGQLQKILARPQVVLTTAAKILSPTSPGLANVQNTAVS